MISPNLGVPHFNESSPFLFNTWPHDYILSEKLADFVYGKGHRSVALVGAEQVWVKEQSVAFKKRFEELGGKIAYFTEPLPGTQDLRTEAIKIKNTKDIDAFVSTSDGIVIGSLIAKALKELDVHLPMYTITLDQSAIDASHGGFNGLSFLTFLTPSSEFQKRYEDRYKTNIDIGADSAYDAVMMLAQAIRDSKSEDPETVAQYLSQIREYSGVSGELKSDGRRGFVKAYATKRVKGGRPEPEK